MPGAVVCAHPIRLTLGTVKDTRYSIVIPVYKACVRLVVS